MGGCPGSKLPSDMLQVFISAFCGGIVGGIIHQLIMPSKVIALVFLGIVGGWLGVTTYAWHSSGKQGNFIAGMIELWPWGVGLFYVSMPGALLVYALLK